MVTVLAVAVVVLAGCYAVAWRAAHQRKRELVEAWGSYVRMAERAETYLSMLVQAGLVNTVTSCERTKGGVRP